MTWSIVDEEQLVAARKAIGDRFLQQCKYGRQNDGLPPNVKACGQLLGSDSKQRGAHGTAAALRVLAQEANDESRRIVPQLIAYVEQRDTIELAEKGSNSPMAAQLQRDAANVIKVSELVYALSFVDAGVAQRESLQQSLVTVLENGKVDDRGWDFFTDAKNEIQLLPTAHAVRALSRHGSDVTTASEYLLDALVKAPMSSGSSKSDISVRVFCLFVLAFPAGDVELAPIETLRVLFRPMWTQLEGLLHDDLEQNIEYSWGVDHFYVRVPYQLYLLALAAKLRPLRGFASISAQTRLASILRALKTSEGFLYPHSGRYVSSRTNAIVYDTFTEARKELVRSPVLFFVANFLDRIRGWLNSRFVVWVGYAAALGVIGYSLLSWILKGGSIGAALGPNFGASLILLLLSARKRR